MGAWIETLMLPSDTIRLIVAPYVGAWIETDSCRSAWAALVVAPYVGAWIETRWQTIRMLMAGGSHPMWVRGLKLRSGVTSQGAAASHPMWVRGLKLRLAEPPLHLVYVAPYVGAWIETSVEADSIWQT